LNQANIRATPSKDALDAQRRHVHTSVDDTFCTDQAFFAHVALEACFNSAGGKSYLTCTVKRNFFVGSAKTA
jgi:hypothetical protein